MKVHEWRLVFVNGEEVITTYEVVEEDEEIDFLGSPALPHF